MTTPLASGWYNDPDDPTQMREWDGEQWTANSMPVTAYAAFVKNNTPEKNKPERPGLKNTEENNALPSFTEMLAAEEDSPAIPKITDPISSSPLYQMKEYTGEEDKAAENGAEPPVKKGDKPEGGVIRSAGILEDQPISDPIFWAAILVAGPISFLLGQRAHFTPALDGIVGIALSIFITLFVILVPGMLRMTKRNASAVYLLAKSQTPGWHPDPAKVASERFSDGSWTRYVKPQPSGRYISIILVFILSVSGFLLGNALPSAGLVSTFSKPPSTSVPASVETYVSAWWSTLTPDQKILACERYHNSPEEEVDIRASALYSEVFFSPDETINDPFLSVGNIRVALENLFTASCVKS